jgi:hypothetical protein
MFYLDGSGLKRFAQHGQLNAPWGTVVPPSGFGELGETYGLATSATAASTPTIR